MIYEGKIGVKLTFDFDQAKININIYMNYLSIYFEFYFEFKIRILWLSRKKKFSYKLGYPSKILTILNKDFNLYDKKNRELI